MSNSVTPCTVAHQAPLSMVFPRQEYWSGLPFLSPGDLPDPGIKPASPALAGWFFTTKPSGRPLWKYKPLQFSFTLPAWAGSQKPRKYKRRNLLELGTRLTKKKKERRKKKKNYQKPRLKQTKNCFNIQPRVYYFLNDQSRTRENYIISVITEEKAT